MTGAPTLEPNIPSHPSGIKSKGSHGEPPKPHPTCRNMNCPTCGYLMGAFEKECARCAVAPTHLAPSPPPTASTTQEKVTPRTVDSDPTENGLWHQAPFRLGFFMSFIGFIGLRLMIALFTQRQPPGAFDQPSTSTVIGVLTTVGLFLLGVIGALLMLIGLFKSLRRREA
jgi:hypothetical protein